MPDAIDSYRRTEDFLYPPPKTSQRLLSIFAAAVSYPEGIDESKFQYSSTKSVDHVAALLGKVTFTAIRVSNCVTVDPCFERAWNNAAEAGMPIMLYANVQGYKTGKEQAEFALKTAEPFIKVCKTKVVIFGDFEEDWTTIPISARQKLATDFLNNVHTYYDTGIYSNWKYWTEMYGNLKPPPWAWLWGAHWTNMPKGTFPSSWDLTKLIIWQYGVWDNQSWALPILGNKPDIDKNRWVWSGGDVNKFLELDTPPFPPVPPTDIEGRLTLLENQMKEVRAKLGM